MKENIVLYFAHVVHSEHAFVRIFIKRISLTNYLFKVYDAGENFIAPSQRTSNKIIHGLFDLKKSYLYIK